MNFLYSMDPISASVGFGFGFGWLVVVFPEASCKVLPDLIRVPISSRL